MSTWLNGGVTTAQVAEWAGHSVAVLLRVYAKRIDDQDELAKRQIKQALRDPDEPDEYEPRVPANFGAYLARRAASPCPQSRTAAQRKVRESESLPRSLE